MVKRNKIVERTKIRDYRWKYVQQNEKEEFVKFKKKAKEIVKEITRKGKWTEDHCWIRKLVKPLCHLKVENYQKRKFV